jgi:hypothetical protein
MAIIGAMANPNQPPLPSRIRIRALVIEVTIEPEPPSSRRPTAQVIELADRRIARRPLHSEPPRAA